jgi:hypothetical protein
MKIRIDLENKDAVIAWLERIKKGSGNAKPLWKAMTPKITEFVDWQFRSESDVAKRWKKLKPSYKAWKIKKGFSSGIGVMTGKLREGSGTSAKKKYTRKILFWRVNESYVRNKKGQKYARYFNKVRPIYKNVAFRVNSFLSFDVKQFKSGSYNSFTYIWLRNALTKGVKK